MHFDQFHNDLPLVTDISSIHVPTLEDDDLEIKDIFNFIERKKYFIAGFTFLLATLGVIYSLIQQPVYRGKFQILVEI